MVCLLKAVVVPALLAAADNNFLTVTALVLMAFLSRMLRLLTVLTLLHLQDATLRSRSRSLVRLCTPRS